MQSGHKPSDCISCASETAYPFGYCSSAIVFKYRFQPFRKIICLRYQPFDISAHKCSKRTVFRIHLSSVQVVVHRNGIRLHLYDKVSCDARLSD